MYFRMGMYFPIHVHSVMHRLGAATVRRYHLQDRNDLAERDHPLVIAVGDPRGHATWSFLGYLEDESTHHPDAGNLADLQILDELSTFQVFNSSNPSNYEMLALERPTTGPQMFFRGPSLDAEACLTGWGDSTLSTRLFDRLQSLRFLEHFTRSTGIVESFECAETSELITRYTVNYSREAEYGERYHHSLSTSAVSSFEACDQEVASASSFYSLASSIIPISGPHSLDPLSETSHRAIARLRDIISTKHHGGQRPWSLATEELCLQLFLPARLRLFIDMFWCQWYPNSPIIHKPTFNVETAPEELLYPMVVLGACTSRDVDHRKVAGFWFDIVEELVFTSPLLDFDCDGSSPWSCNRPGSRKQLQALQGAYCVCLYQNWDGSDKAKRRIRNQRFTVLVTAARDIGFESATHNAVDLDVPGSFDWERWVVTEEMVRTMSYIFLIDSAFMIFNNLPPRFVISELGLGLTSPESCFQAECHSSCLQALQHESRQQNIKFSVASAVDVLCHSEFGTRLITDFSGMSVLNMFCIVSALHIVLFNLRSSICSPSLIQSVKNGFLNWDKVWMANAVYEQFAEQHDLPQEPSWKKLGFIRHCREYCFLGLVMCEKLRSGIREETNSIILSGVPDRYGATDMRQANELIRRLSMAM
ncbi:hypothetical protein PVAR5_0940 [Paecilomyces variotii No. 5]|uniref:Xylanolytic transcriptional activator regulatory domain-containing protein n=1 Tax=Byssochlamys spectabilis (strain No. 5 / NBRC 109023) TaxID=1356009 RepID=V5F8P2_BYSSN|nr:hypothetical protein PVAR5_0940 [Paecilomyces variotii No. 5]